MSRPSVIVIGTGRSGTSTIARILHEKLGVCMGHYFKIQKRGGTHEDYMAHAFNRMVSDGSLSAKAWLSIMSKCHNEHWACKRWGAKDPWFLYWPMSKLRWLNPGLIVRTWRPKQDVVASWLALRRHWDREEPTREKEDHFEKLYDDREMLAKEIEEFSGLNVLTIRFDRQLSDEEIAIKISQKMSTIEQNQCASVPIGELV